MTTYISLLRGINVGGQKAIRMAELRSLYEAIGFTRVQTYVQSGNVIFDSSRRDAKKLAVMIEASIQQAFGFDVAVFLRQAEDFHRFSARNPFLNSRHADAARLHVTFLQHIPDQASLSKLVIPAGCADEFFIDGAEVFLFCPAGYGNTKLSNTFFEKKLNLSATTRNWNTVQSLHQLASAGDQPET